MNRLLLLISFVITPVLAQGATYYVAKTGRDSNTCSQAQSASTPKLTISSGLACLSGGDMLIIKGGTYTEGVQSDAIPSGLSETQRTIIKAASGEKVIVNGLNSIGDVWSIYDRSYITLDGLTIDGSNATYCGLRIGGSTVGSHYVTAQNGEILKCHWTSSSNQGAGLNSNLKYINLHIHNGGRSDSNQDHGIYIVAHDSLVERCNIHDITGHGIHIFTSSGTNNNNVIRNNTIHDNDSFGVLLGSGSNNYAYNNVVYGNGRHISGTGGMWIAYYGASGNKIYNNTIYNNTGIAIRIRTDGSAIVRNNICYQNSTDSIDDETGTASISNNLFTNPLFIGAFGFNFALSADSPAIDKGMTISEVPNDFNGVTRPQGAAFDIGAFEYTGTQQATPPGNLRLVGKQ